MGQPSKLLDSNVVKIAMEGLKELGSSAYVSRKLHAVIAASKHGITEVSKVYDISRTTLTLWVKQLKTNGIGGLKAPESRKRKAKLNDLQVIKVKSWVEESPNVTIKSLRIRIEKELLVNLSKSSVHRLIKKLKFSYITPRPFHYKRDKSRQEEFKKKSLY